MTDADREALAAAIGADTDEWVIDAILANRDEVLRALGIKETDRDAVRKTVEGAMSTAEGRWTGNPVDITNALVDFLQWESDKYKARAEDAERDRDLYMDAWREEKQRRIDTEAALARVRELRDEYKRDDNEHLNMFGQHHPVAGIAYDHLTAALADPEEDR